MPLLAAAVEPTTPEVRGAIAGSWAGDLALLSSTDAGLLGGIGGFAAAHAAYLRALWNVDASPAGKSEAVAGIAYTATFLAASTAIWRTLHDRGALRVPVIGYAALVSTMGFAAARSGSRVGGSRGARMAAGGALFVISDGLVALSKFGGKRRPLVNAAVMATYTAAQGLLASSLTPVTNHGSAG